MRRLIGACPAVRRPVSWGQYTSPRRRLSAGPPSGVRGRHRGALVGERLGSARHERRDGHAGEGRQRTEREAPPERGLGRERETAEDWVELVSTVAITA